MSIKKISAKKIYSSVPFDVFEEALELAPGKVISRSIVRHRGAVVIVPMASDGSLVLVNQYRHPIGKDLLEFPAGTLEVGEDPLLCAKREIEEEIKFQAKTWKHLGNLYPAPGFCDEYQYLYFAADLFESYAEADEDEMIEVVSMSVPEVEKAIKENSIQDAKTIAAFCRARMLGCI